MAEFHYTYLINNIVTGMCYIGSRSSNKPPYSDLGITYFSSSSDAEFIKDQKIKHFNYKYTILNTFSNRSDAFDDERRLHLLYDVANNSKFINRAVACSNKFNNKGNVIVKDTRDNLIKTVSKIEYRGNNNYISLLSGKVFVKTPQGNVKIDKCCFNSEDYISVNKGKVTCYNDEGVSISIPQDEFNRSNFKGVRSGKLSVLNKVTGEKEEITSTNYDRDIYSFHTEGKVSVIRLEDNKRMQVTVDEYTNNRDKYITMSTGKVSAFDVSNGRYIQVNKEEYYSNPNLISPSTALKGKKRFKYCYHIINNYGEITNVLQPPLKDSCINIGIPYNLFLESMYNSRIIGFNDNSIEIIRRKGYDKYIGWKCIKSKEI